MKLCKFFAVFFIAIIFLYPGTGVFAQVPSLAAADEYVVTVETENGEETFTIIRDGRIEEQFYYVPIKPVVASKSPKGGTKTPVFNLLRYQHKNENNELVNGGILQMSMVMTVSEKTREALLRQIRRKFIFKDYSKQHRLSPLPIKKSELALYDIGGDLLAQAPPKGGIGPVFGTQHYPFMLKLKELGADVMAELCKKNGGVPVLITYTFSGMTPKVGFEVEVNWDACYNHFSTDTNVGIEAVKNGIGGGLGLDISTLREEFESKGLIKITSLADETVTSEQLDELMSPVLNLITAELFEQLHCPTSIDPAEARSLKEPNKYAEIAKAATSAVKSLMGKAFFSAKAQVNFALKDVKKVKKGKFTYKFDRQTIMDRTACFGGLLGIGDYPKEIQDQVITVMPAGRWEAAYFSLPEVGDPATLGLKAVTISVFPEVKSGSNWNQIPGLKIETAVFNKNNTPTWTDKNGREITTLLFPLQSVYAAEGFNESNYRFKISTNITPASSRSKTLNLVTYSPMFDGTLPVSDPGDLVDTVLIDGCCLSYGEGPDEVYKVVGQLTSGQKTKTKSQISIDSNNSLNVILVPADDAVTINNLIFTSKKGRLGTWKNVNQPLRELEPSLQVLLFDYDWESNPPDDFEMIAPSPF